jgi:DNA-directed RNA polymerase subunit RPC12/RpoP
MLMKIKCPECQNEGTISLLENDFTGPYRCWKCRALYTINIHNGKVLSCEPLSEESLQKIKELDELKKKFMR